MKKSNWIHFIAAACLVTFIACSPPPSNEASDMSHREAIPTSPLGKSLDPRPETEEQTERIRRADEALAANPNAIDLTIEAALAREEVWRYDEAVALYTDGMTKAPDDYRLYLGRAHRLIRLRRFDSALEDLNRSAQLDPYGFNTAYLRGLVYYITGRFDEAADEYGRCLALSDDKEALALASAGEVPGDPRHCMVIAADDRSKVALTMWMYRALRRAGRDEEAALLLETVQEGLSLSDGPTSYETSTIKPGSNQHYYQTLLMYRGLLDEEEILDREKLQGQWSTVAYGVAVWHLVEGNREKAITLLREIVNEPYWARLGHVAAEADLVRLGAAR